MAIDFQAKPTSYLIVFYLRSFQTSTCTGMLEIWKSKINPVLVQRDRWVEKKVSCLEWISLFSNQTNLKVVFPSIHSYPFQYCIICCTNFLQLFVRVLSVQKKHITIIIKHLSSMITINALPQDLTNKNEKKKKKV